MIVQNLVVLPDCHLPREFSLAVKMLVRPYQKLSKQEVEYIERIAAEANTDILADENGRQYTWGHADGCVQLMPIQTQYNY